MVQLVHPLTVGLILFLAATLLFLAHRRKTATSLAVLAIGGLYTMATPAISDWLRASLEHQHEPTPIEALPNADAIVVLGGGIDPVAPPRRDHNLGHAFDRIWFGAALHRAGKAPRVVTHGWRRYPDDGPTAAEAAAAVLMQLGVPGDAIITQSDARTTHTEARATLQVIEEHGIDDILLVTSALHMPRALATFRAAGIPAHAAPTDYEVTDFPPATEYRWLPDNKAFWAAGRAWHEYVGMAYYRLRGWM